MGFEPMIEVLQTSALPLGYVAQPPRFYRNRGGLSKATESFVERVSGLV
jgi:hypothetical protein